MPSASVIPSPQHRYLEPYKNIMYQYNTSNSNMLLSRYTNEILHVAGNDKVVRGLEVIPKIQENRRGVDFSISSGDIIHDLTYIEIRENLTLSIDDLINYDPNIYDIIVYTNYRYVESIYDNDLSIEITLFNKKTSETLTPWKSDRYRVILGHFSFRVQDGMIVSVMKSDTSGVSIKDTNTIVNGSFENTVQPWVSINSSLSINRANPYQSVSCLEILRTSGTYQGAYQVFRTEIDKMYKITGYVRAGSSGKNIPWKVKVCDGDATIKGENIYEYAQKEGITDTNWAQFDLVFKAVGKDSTIFLYKTDTTAGSILFDEVHCYLYKSVRPMPDLQVAREIDGGLQQRKIMENK